MADLVGSLRSAAEALRRFHADFAVVGGLAVAVRAEPRLTRDADLAVAVANDAEAEQLIFNLQSVGYHAFAAVEHERHNRLATIRLSATVPSGAVVDLLFASCGIEREVVNEAEQIEIVRGLTLPVAQVGHLMVMKVLSRDDRFRPADADDLVGLSLVATDTDWDRALAAARLVEQRGYNRDRDIVIAIEALRDRPGMY